MTEQDLNRNDWLKVWAAIGGVVLTALIQVIGMVWYFGTTLTKFEGKIELVNKSVEVVSDTVVDFKADVKSTMLGIKGDIKEVSTMGLKMAEHSLRLGVLEKRIDLIEERKAVRVDPPLGAR